VLYLGESLPHLRVIGEAKPPERLKSFIGQVTGPTGSYRWTQVEGNVHQIVSRATTLEIELQSRSGTRMQIDIADATELPLELLAKSQIRVVGVNRDVVIPGGQRVVGLLSTVGRREVQLMEVAPETWAAFQSL
jgi:hypothetical protein